MRNYIFTRGMFWRIPYFDDMHVLQGDAPASAIGNNDADLSVEITKKNDSFLSSLPAGWSIEPNYPNAVMTIYFLLDKDSLMVTFKGFAEIFVQDAFINHPPAFPILVSPDETPRKTGWTDPDGVKRQPPPSERKGGATAQSFPGPFYRWIIRFGQYLVDTGQLRKNQELYDSIVAYKVGKLSLLKWFDTLRGILAGSGFK